MVRFILNVLLVVLLASPVMANVGGDAEYQEKLKVIGNLVDDAMTQEMSDSIMEEFYTHMNLDENQKGICVLIIKQNAVQL